MDAIDKLLALELPEPQTVTKRIKRLGLDITLRELTYAEMARCRKKEQDNDLHYLLASTVSPDFKDKRFYHEKMGCDSVIDAMKKLFSSGEIRALVAECDRLNGYFTKVLEDPKALEDAALEAALEDLGKN